MVRTAVSWSAAGAAALVLVGSLARLVGLRSTLVKDRPSFPQPDAGFVLAHDARSKGRPVTTYVTRGDLTAEKEALGVALLGAMAFAGALLIAPSRRRPEPPRELEPPSNWRGR